MMWPLTLAILVVFLGSAAVLSITVSRQQEKRARYMSVLAKAKVPDSQDKATAKQRADVARKLKEASKDEKSSKGKNKVSLRQLIEQAGFATPMSRYWIYSLLFAGVMWVLLIALSWPKIAKIFIVIAAFFGIPKMFLKWKAKRRQHKFLVEFADALDAMVRLLQAGMPMSEAIAMGSREFTGPLKEELMRVYEDQKIGVPIGEAALYMARRVPLTETHMFATALQIQSETGSSLSEVLSNLSGVIRARFRLKRKVKALSSEAKASAGIIGCLPLLVSLGLYLARPQYIGLLFTLPTGKMMLGGCIFWMSLGILMMRQMINFKI